MLDGMTPDQLSKLIHELHGTNASAQVLSQVRELLVRHLAKSDPHGAMTFAIAGHFSDATLESLMNGWAHTRS